MNNDPINGVDYLGLADYGKADLSGQLTQTWSDGMAAYASYSVADWAGWALEQTHEFSKGMAIGVGKGAGDIAGGLWFLAKGAVKTGAEFNKMYRKALFGGPEGPLGRYYMGHLNGQIADIVVGNQTLHDGLDFFVDDHGSYVRRRLMPAEWMQEREALANIAFWPVVPETTAQERYILEWKVEAARAPAG